MSRAFSRRLACAGGVLVMMGAVAGSGCSKKSGGTPTSPSPPTDPTYDVEALGVPRFAGADYIDLSAIGRFSRFRSSVGHDFHDAFETCRSMKHYFEPRASVDWSQVAVFSPVQGTVTATTQEANGLKVEIRSTVQPAFTFAIFHLNPGLALATGTVLSQGQTLGRHIGSQTMSDISIGVSTPTGFRNVSWFEAMTDGVFAGYAARGVASRASAIITRAERDADPLTCGGETFLTFGTIPNWITLQ